MDSSMRNIFFAEVPICPSGFSEGLWFRCVKREKSGKVTIRVMFSMIGHCLQSAWKTVASSRAEDIFSFQ